MEVEIRRVTTMEIIGAVLLVFVVVAFIFLAGQVTGAFSWGPEPQPRRYYLETVPQHAAGGGMHYVVRYLESGETEEIYCYSEAGRNRATFYAGGATTDVKVGQP